MSASWPQYRDEPLDGSRSWSATFDSYDEYHDDVYYLVTISDAGKELTPFMVKVSAAFPNDEWIEPEATNEIRRRVAQVAATGKTNTTYRGPVLRS